MKMNKNDLFGKKTRIGAYIFTVTLIVLALLAAVNFIVLKLPSKYTKLDVTAKNLYTLSDTTKNAIPNITDDVKIYLLCSGGEDESGSSLNNIPELSTYLSKYAELSDRISVEIVDPVANPQFTTKYTETSPDNYSIIIESDKRFKIINFSDLYYYYNESYGRISAEEYSTFMMYMSYYGQSVSLDLCFDGESVITSALDFVTTDNIPSVYSLTDHGETALSSTLLAEIENNNMTCSSLSLLTSNIPEDAECIIINLPTSDINADEAAAISSYLAGGGHIMLTTTFTNTDLPNLMALLADYGMSASEGLVIESESGKYYSGYPHYLLPNVSGSSEITATLADSARIIAPLAHGIETSGDKTYTPLFTTSSSAYNIPADAETTEKTDESVVGTYNISVLCEDSETGARIIWTGSDAWNDSMNSVTSGNYRYFISMLGSMVERTKITYEIPSKTIGANSLVVTESQATLWSALLVVIIPLAFAICGIVYCYERRRK